MVKSPQKFEYLLNDSTFATEEALHVTDGKTCDAGAHDWKKSFVYGKYSCRNCEAKRMKIK